MKIKLLQEATLEFGAGTSICPREGISNFGPYDIDSLRPEKIKTAIVGKSSSIDVVSAWLEKAKLGIERKDSKQPNLFTDFCGFNPSVGFNSEIIYDDSYLRKIKNSDFKSILTSTGEKTVLISNTVELFINEIKFLTKNKNPDIILCVLPEEIVKHFKQIKREKTSDVDDINLEDSTEEGDSPLEHDLRRLLKARSMYFGTPIQIIRDRIKSPTSEMQDEATIAWNLFTALYYKAAGTPWALKKTKNEIVCYAGVSFYKSRDKTTTQTSCTQIFNEHGKGVILRGAPVELKKGDRDPHLSEEHAYDLLNRSLNEYYEALKIYPQRLVLHKSSNFSEDEIIGFTTAANENSINSIDLATIGATSIRLFGRGPYPPNRGTIASFTDDIHLIYTKGFVPYYNTYPGQYIPNPIEVRLFNHDESPELICQEILALTKMNWNNTQFDRKFPITIECSRKVGDILKYLQEDQEPQLKYSFYM